MSDDPQVIGTETEYIGHEKRHGGYRAKVLVTGIFRYDEHEESADRFVTTNQRLAELGGVRPQDGVEVHHLMPDGNWGFVGYEIEHIWLLAAFAHLKPDKE